MRRKQSATRLSPENWVTGAIAALSKRIGIRRTTRILSDLDDRTLRDIGLTREDIPAVARDPAARWRRIKPSAAMSRPRLRVVERRKARADRDAVDDNAPRKRPHAA